jgi:hypothetical protein
MGALGAYDSGATRTALQEQGANMASDALGQYMSMLQAQQQTGLSAAGALAGVSTNTMGAVNAATQMAGSATANAALAAGNAQGQMYGNIANSVGSLASSFFRPQTYQPQPYMTSAYSGAMGSGVDYGEGALSGNYLGPAL